MFTACRYEENLFWTIIQSTGLINSTLNMSKTSLGINQSLINTCYCLNYSELMWGGTILLTFTYLRIIGIVILQIITIALLQLMIITTTSGCSSWRACATSTILSLGCRPALSAGEFSSTALMYWPGRALSLCRLKPYPLDPRSITQRRGLSSGHTSWTKTRDKDWRVTTCGAVG